MNRTPELLAELRAEIEGATRSELPSIRGQLAELEAVIQMRITSPQQLAELPHADDEGDRLIDVKAAADKMQMSERYLYEHAQEYGGAKYGGALRFSVRRLDSIIRNRSRRS